MAVVAGSALVEGMPTAMEQGALKLPETAISREVNR